jgi:hypothetical protein
MGGRAAGMLFEGVSMEEKARIRGGEKTVESYGH